jgi:protein-disulfide isomerase
MQGRGHPLACVAAKHGHCVFKAKGNDAFFVYEKSVFGQQSQLSVPLIEEIALKSGIGKDELKACVDSPETHASIVAQAEEGKAVGVTGTPAVYVNGRRLEYGSVAKVLKAVLARYSETSANAGQ